MSLLNDSWLKVFRFVIVGSANTMSMYLLYIVMVFVGLSFNIALIIDYIVGIIFGYVVHRYWTFADSTTVMKSFPKYCVIYVGTYFINVTILNLIVRNNMLQPILGQLVALGIVAPSSFLLQNFWVFPKQSISLNKPWK